MKYSQSKTEVRVIKTRSRRVAGDLQVPPGSVPATMVIETNSLKETGFRYHVFGPIDDSTTPFDAVARVLCAGLPGFVFHRVLPRQECPQLTRSLATLTASKRRPGRTGAGSPSDRDYDLAATGVGMRPSCVISSTWSK